MRFDGRAILKRFGHLVLAHGVREVSYVAFFLVLARTQRELFGNIMLAMGAGQMLLLIADLGINQHLVVRLSRSEADAGQRVSQVTVIKLLLLAVGWTALVATVWLLGYEPGLVALIAVVAGGTGLESLANTFYVLLRVQGRQSVEGRIGSLAGIGGAMTGLLSVGLRAPGIVTGSFRLVESLIHIAGAVGAGWGALKGHLAWPRWTEVRETWVATRTFTLMMGSGIAFNHLNLFFLERAGGAEGLAQYSAAWQLTNGIHSVVSSLLLANVLYPLVAGLWKTDPGAAVKATRETVAWIALLYIPVTFLLCAEGDRLVLLLFGEGYGAAARLQPLIAGFLLFGALQNAGSNLMMAMGEEKRLVVYLVGGLGLNAVLCATLIPRFPLVGSVLSIVLTRTAVGVFSVGWCQRRHSLLPWRRLAEAGGAAVAGWILYWTTRASIPRILADALGILPGLLLAAAWWRADRRSP